MMILITRISKPTVPSSHVFIPPREGQSRAPCPALNALANHGYISRDGKDLTITELVRALQAVYNLSFTLAMLLSLVAVIFCGHGLRLNLGDLAEHDVIEHNGSLVHEDCSPGDKFARSTPNPELLQNLLHRVATGHGLSLNDLARARADRESRLPTPLDSLHSQIATGESALTWLVMKDQHDEIPVNTIKEWYGKERLPHGWVAPAKPIGLFSARGTASTVAKQMRSQV